MIVLAGYFFFLSVCVLQTVMTISGQINCGRY